MIALSNKLAHMSQQHIPLASILIPLTHHILICLSAHQTSVCLGLLASHWRLRVVTYDSYGSTSTYSNNRE